jgi:dihydrofolate synthase/folylpolyglutamate synthase
MLKTEPGEQIFSVAGMLRDYPLLRTGLLGAHQRANAVTAIAVCEILDKFYNIKVEKGAFARGIDRVYWPGRMELLGGKPAVLLDGAHNRASAACLKQAIKNNFPGRSLTLILGVLKDKDIRGIVRELEGISERVILTSLPGIARSERPEKIAFFFEDKSKILKHSTAPAEALDAALTFSRQQDLILVTGSMVLVGEMMRILKSEKEPAQV